MKCQNRVVRVQFPNELELELEGCGSNLRGKIVSHLKTIRCYLKAKYAT